MIGRQSNGRRSRGVHLTPAEKRILLILLDKDSTIEMTAEIAAATGYSKGSIDHMLANINNFFGVRSARGLLRMLDVIADELSKNANI